MHSRVVCCAVLPVDHDSAELFGSVVGTSSCYRQDCVSVGVSGFVFDTCTSQRPSSVHTHTLSLSLV